MTQRIRPPSRQRATASDVEVDALAAATGVRFTAAAAAVILDPRGRAFQRAEWLGDSILDGLAADLRLRDPFCADHTSDAALTQRAQRSGLVHLLDWTPGGERLADLVEAIIGLAWLDHGWDGARTVTARLVDPAFAAEPARHSDPLSWEEIVHAANVEPTRAEAGAGAAILEASVAIALFRAHTAADEATLTDLREQLLATRRLVAVVDPVCRTGLTNDIDHRADHVQAAIGRALREHTLDAAVTSALPLAAH